jgi:hypothetical protein
LHLWDWDTRWGIHLGIEGGGGEAKLEAKSDGEYKKLVTQRVRGSPGAPRRDKIAAFRGREIVSISSFVKWQTHNDHLQDFL